MIEPRLCKNLFTLLHKILVIILPEQEKGGGTLGAIFRLQYSWDVYSGHFLCSLFIISSIRVHHYSWERSLEQWWQKALMMCMKEVVMKWNMCTRMGFAEQGMEIAKW